MGWGRAAFGIGVAVLFVAFVLYVRAKGYPAWWSLLFFRGRVLGFVDSA